MKFMVAIYNGGKERTVKRLASFVIVCAMITTPSLTLQANGETPGSGGGESGNATIFVQLGQKGVLAVALSPDGKYALSGGVDHALKLWNVSSGKEMRTFLGHSMEVDAVAFSPDGKYALSGAIDNSMKLWDIASGTEIRTFTGHDGMVLSVAFSPDGKYALSGSSDATLKLWDVSTGEATMTFTGSWGDVIAVAFSRDGKRIASGGMDSTVRIWDAGSGELLQTFRGHTNWVSSVAFSPDGRFVLSGSEDNTLKLWDLAEGQERKTFVGHSYEVKSALFSPDGRYVVSGSTDHTTRLWDVSTGKQLKLFDSGPDVVVSMSFSKDGKYVLTGGSNAMRLWDISTGEVVQTYTARTRSVASVAFSSTGKYVLSSSTEDSTLKLWDVSSGREVRVFSGHSGFVNAVAFSPDGHSAVSGGEDRTLKLWNVSSGEVIKTLAADNSWVNSVAYSPDGKYVIAACWDNTLKLWDASTGEKLRLFAGHSDLINSVVFSPDGKSVLSGSIDGTLKIWDVSTAVVLSTITAGDPQAADIEQLKSVAFSPNNAYVLSASDLSVGHHTLRLWNVATGELVRKFEGRTNAGDCAAFSHDGNYVLGVDGDNSVDVWNTETGELVKTLSGHLSNVTSLTFSPDDKYVLSGSADGTVRLWDVQGGREIVSMIGFPKDQWITITPTGYFDASPTGARDVNVRIGNTVYSMDNFFQKYYRPDIIEASVQGKDVTKLALTDLTRGVKVPPDVALLVVDREGRYRGVSELNAKDIPMENGAIKVRIVATNAGGGIRGVRLFDNDKVVGENIRGFKVVESDNQLERDFELSLSPGSNVLKAIGFSIDMTESNPVTASLSYVPATVRKPDMYILAIGINEYRNSNYDLNYCADDASGFMDAIVPNARKLFAHVSTILLKDRNATRARVLAAIDSIKTLTRPEDVFVLYYAGHGIALDVQDESKSQKSEFYYVLQGVTQMTDPSKCSQEGISGTEMRTLMADVKANKQVLFVDACNSGALAAEFAARGAAEENALAKLSRATGSVIYASTTKEQFATEFVQLKHGAFTYVLINALSGKACLPNGQITVSSIKAYVDDEIPLITKEYKGEEQYPTTFIWGQDFPIAIAK